MKGSCFAFFGLLAAMLLFLSAQTVVAGPCGCPGGGPDGDGCQGMTQEQRDKFDRIMSDYGAKIRDAEGQVFIAEQELRALQHASQPDVGAVRKAATRLVELDARLDEIYRELGKKLEEAVGRPFGFHHGRGFQHGGRHGKRADGPRGRGPGSPFGRMPDSPCGR